MGKKSTVGNTAVTLIIVIAIVVSGGYLYYKFVLQDYGNVNNTALENTDQNINDQPDRNKNTVENKNGENLPVVNTDEQNTVPELTQQDVITLFFSLIDEKRIPEALDMMSADMLGDEDSKQTWAVQFNDIRSVNVLEIVPQITDNDTPIYRVKLEIYVDSRSANAPIPYYGYGDNPNLRWVSLAKEGDLWKINQISTGP